LAWLLTRPTITAPIASATNVTQLRELLDATELNLDRDFVELLDQASASQASATQ
jgi:aryl-alcohol dehydrogenase-like predicted oxidoreductase